MSNLDPYERWILRSYERGEWKSVKNLDQEKARLMAMARNTMRKLSRVNIRISPDDLLGIQQRAFEEGIPYQTLMASVIHKYVSGRLVDRRP